MRWVAVVAEISAPTENSRSATTVLGLRLLGPAATELSVLYQHGMIADSAISASEAAFQRSYLLQQHAVVCPW